MALTFIDSGVLIAAFRGRDELSERAMAVLDDPDRSFASSEFVRLEVLPRPEATTGPRGGRVRCYTGAGR
jgi:predicted nucleic acid-binding protein